MDGATLWVGVAGVVLATVSLTWQAVTFRLTGGRVVAHLQVGVRSPGGSVSQRVRKDWMRHLVELSAQQPVTPLLVLEVSNVGRMAVGMQQALVVVEGGPRILLLDAFNPVAGSSLAGGHAATWYATLEPVQAAVDATAARRQDRRPRKVWMELQLGTGGKPVRTREAIAVSPRPAQP